MVDLTIVKVGGKIVEEQDSLQDLLSRFSSIKGHKLLVHGGGRSATRLAETLGLESQMVKGRRVTDSETLKIVTMVYGGLVNKNIVAQLQAVGVNALGLTGVDMDIIRSDKRPVKTVDYGYVGDVKSVNAMLLGQLIDMDIVPVLAPLTHDGKGHILNTNADTIAGETAKAMSGLYNVKLVFCFEKRGVLMDEMDENSVVENLNKEEFERLVDEGVIQGGMIPKLENAFLSIESGVKEVVITQASDLDKASCGTHIRAF